MNTNWYALDKKKMNDGSLDVYILDEIGGWGISASDFISEINESAEDGKELRVHVNSPGGDVYDGLAIYHFLSRRANVTTINEGIAASMASIVMMAGKIRVTPENAFTIIHNPWSIRVGNADELREAADGLDKLAEGLVSIYAKGTGLDKDELRDMMKAETMMNGIEAVEKGFATVTTEAVKIAASFDTAKLNKIPEQMANALVQKEKNMDELKKSQEELAAANAALTSAKGEYEAKAKADAKESFDAGVAAGQEQALGNVKARMDRYKDESFVVETIDLTDNEVKDKYIIKLQEDNKAKGDALDKLVADDGIDATQTQASNADAPADNETDTPKARNAARVERVDALKAEGKSVLDAWKTAHAEMPDPEIKED